MSWKDVRSKNIGKFWHCNRCTEDIGLPFNHIKEDIKFKLELYRIFENTPPKDDIVNHLQNLQLDPTIFQTELDDNNCNSYTEYYSEDQLTSLHEESQNNVSMLNANIRSLGKKFDSFKDVLSCSKMQFEIIELVETWLKDKPFDYFHLDGYSLEFNNRKLGKGGGVCLYIKNDMKYHVRNDLAVINHPENVESLFVEIERTGLNNIIIGVIYRPPGQDIKEFNIFKEVLLSKIMHNEKPVYLMGDFNINLLNEDVHTLTNDFLNIMSSNSLYPSITKPTRITSNSATLIDNIFTNSKSYQTSGIIITDISDHLPVFITTDLKLHRNNIDKLETDVRQFNAENMKCFKSELGKVNWENLCSEGDANKSYKCFIDKFNSLYDKCFPKSKKVLSKRVNKIKSPWLSYGILKCIRRKNRLYKTFLRKKKKKKKKKKQHEKHLESPKFNY